jgi:lysophospholipase L1-like esterase
MKTLAQNLLLAVVSTTLFLLLGEAAARLRYSPAEAARNGLYEYDPDKVYALRKSLTHASFAGLPVTTNSLGHRDREIPLVKPPRGFRVLAIGDSVTFGHGVRVEEAWPDVLERKLAPQLPDRQVDVVNTGVPGNSPFQEYYDLERGLVLQPDAAVIQFVLNDLIEPYKVFRRYGGSGRDYHGIDDVPWWDHMISSRSALYLLMEHAIARIRFHAVTARGVREQAMRQEAELSWNAGADAPTDPRVQEAWRECLAWLQKEVDLCRRSGVALVLMITPVQLQFDAPSRTYAQQRLADFARDNHVEFLDLLPMLWERAASEVAAAHSGDTDTAPATLATRYPREWAAFWQRYFLDYDHFNPVGHELVATALLPLVEPLAAR